MHGRETRCVLPGQRQATGRLACLFFWVTTGPERNDDDADRPPGPGNKTVIGVAFHASGIAWTRLRTLSAALVVAVPARSPPDQPRRLPRPRRQRRAPPAVPARPAGRASRWPVGGLRVGRDRAWLGHGHVGRRAGRHPAPATRGRVDRSRNRPDLLGRRGAHPGHRRIGAGVLGWDRPDVLAGRPAPQGTVAGGDLPDARRLGDRGPGRPDRQPEDPHVHLRPEEHPGRHPPHRHPQRLRARRPQPDPTRRHPRLGHPRHLQHRHRRHRPPLPAPARRPDHPHPHRWHADRHDSHPRRRCRHRQPGRLPRPVRLPRARWHHHATLTIHLTDLSIGDLAGPITTDTLPPVTFPIAIPAPTAPAVPAHAATHPVAYRSIGLAAGRAPTLGAPHAASPTRGAGTSTGLYALVLPAIAVVAGAAVAATTIRTRWRHQAAALTWAALPDPPASAPPGWPAAPSPVPSPPPAPPPRRPRSPPTSPTRRQPARSNRGPCRRCSSRHRHPACRTAPWRSPSSDRSS